MNQRYTFGIGVDVVDHDRFALFVKRRSRGVDRIFTDGELDYINRFKGDGAIARMAARFGAKEAVSKALGVTLFSLSLHDIEVVNSSDGPPKVKLHAKAKEVAFQSNVVEVKVSFSHEVKVSIAFAMAIAEIRSVDLHGPLELS